jgi:hypothetical protein
MIYHDLTSYRNKLKEVNALVKQHFPKINVVQDCWTNAIGSIWTFCGPDKFTWCGEASNGYDCRCKGWMAYLKHKGIEV